MALINETFGARTGLSDRIFNGVSILKKSWADWRLYRQTLAELERLTERELDDLGIHRSEIYRIAYDGIYGK